MVTKQKQNIIITWVWGWESTKHIKRHKNTLGITFKAERANNIWGLAVGRREGEQSFLTHTSCVPFWHHFSFRVLNFWNPILEHVHVVIRDSLVRIALCISRFFSSGGGGVQLSAQKNTKGNDESQLWCWLCLFDHCDSVNRPSAASCVN